MAYQVDVRIGDRAFDVDRALAMPLLAILTLSPLVTELRVDGVLLLDSQRLQLVKAWHISQHGAGPCGKSCGLECALRGDPS